MSKTEQARGVIDRFMNPSGLALLLSLVLLIINAYASTQLFPILRNVDQLNTRVENLEKKVDGQGLIIIPKGELDARFDSLTQQLNDIKEVLRAK